MILFFPHFHLIFFKLPSFFRQTLDFHFIPKMVKSYLIAKHIYSRFILFFQLDRSINNFLMKENLLIWYFWGCYLTALYLEMSEPFIEFAMNLENRCEFCEENPSKALCFNLEFNSFIIVQGSLQCQQQSFDISSMDYSSFYYFNY